MMSRSRYRESLFRRRKYWLFDELEEIRRDEYPLFHYRTRKNLNGEGYFAIRIDDSQHEMLQRAIRRLGSRRTPGRHCMSSAGWPRPSAPKCYDYRDYDSPGSKKYCKTQAARLRRKRDKKIERAEVYEYFVDQAEYWEEIRAIEREEMNEAWYDVDDGAYSDDWDDDESDFDESYETDIYGSVTVTDSYLSDPYYDEWRHNYPTTEPSPVIIEALEETLADVITRAQDRMRKMQSLQAGTIETMNTFSEALARSNGTQTQEQLADLIVGGTWQED